MKLTAIFTLIIVMQVSAASLAQKITIKEKDAPLFKVFNDISNQTGFDFLFTATTLKDAKLVNINVKDEELTKVLSQIFKDQPLIYTISNKRIVVSQSEQPAAKPAAKSQQSEITGKITDQDGDPLPGVSVSVTHAKASPVNGYATATNDKGIFTVYADPEDIIKFSFVGFAPQQMRIADLPAPLIIILKRSSSGLDEVQIVGYGTTTQRLSTGSEVKVSAKDIEHSPVDNILFSLEGRVPGLQISQSSGVAGSAPLVKIRGTNSIAAGTSPLYILDGIPVPESQSSIGGQVLNSNVSTLLTINPSDIESIEVLKDADATSIYGSRGANGVILITTKRGKSGGTTVNFSAYTGFSQVSHFMDFMNVNQYDNMRRKAYANDGITPFGDVNSFGYAPDLFSWDTTKTKNWQKFLIGKNAPTSDAQLSISGGDGGTHFYINAGIHHEGTVTPGGGDNTRKSFRFNLDHTSADKKFSIGLVGGYAENSLNLQAVDLTNFINLPPSFPLYNSDGSLNFDLYQSPVAYEMQPFNNTQDVYNGQFTTSYKPVKGLTLKLNASLNNSNTNETLEQPFASLNPLYYSGGSLTEGIYQLKSWIIEPQAEYNLHVKKSTFTILAGGTWQKSTTSNFTAQGMGIVNDALIGNLSSAATTYLSTNRLTYAYESVYGRFSYNYDDEYLANATFRRDGSSRFGPDNRFGNFGSLGLAWIFTKEKVIKDNLPFLSYGKLRSSYGTNGNDQIGDYQYLSTYYSLTQGYQQASLVPSSIANANYRWEEDKKFDAALDLGFLNDRIVLTTDLYRDRTDNQLINYVVSPQTGFYSYQANFPAKLQNQGIELLLTTQNIISKKADGFNWKTTFNFTKSQNKLLSFPNIASSSYYSTLIVGQSVNVIQGYQYSGLSNTGAPVIKDVNNDGNYDYRDEKVLGNNDPLNGGITNDLSFKHFSLSFLFDFTRINGFYPSSGAQPAGAFGANQTVGELNAFMSPGDQNKTSIPAYTTQYSYNFSLLNYSNYNYGSRKVFRLRNVELNYTIPKAVLSSLKIKSAQVFARGENIWTSGEGKNLLDPETGNYNLPPLRTIVFGINCSF